MTVAETGEVMDLLAAAYPRFYSGTRDTNVLSLWSTMFAEYPLAMVLQAVREFIATDTLGFPPVIGQIMAKMQYDPVRVRELRKNMERLKRFCAEMDEQDTLEQQRLARLERGRDE